MKSEQIICQQFSVALLSPLERHKGKPRKAGNSARTRGEGERHAIAVHTGIS